MLNSLGLPKPAAATRVVVAMSGGVDSSVAAALARREGYDVVGVTLQLYDHGVATARKGACCAGQDILDARRVAETLDIPHYVLDYEERFRTSVMEDFAASYAAGETPIPCVSCNQTVKFRDLLTTARELDADLLVTGHYVASREVGGRRALYRPVDLARDQSYFLFATTQEQLEAVRFPLGDLTKPETREIARAAGLEVADKPDSQDICFVPSGRYADVVKRLRPDAAEPGEIVHVADGRVLGRHEGIIHYTVGQRKGLGVAAAEPLYVVRLEAEARRVVVGPRAALGAAGVVLRDLNWLGSESFDAMADADTRLFARVRSSRPPQPARLARDADGAPLVLLEEGEDGVSPGQACVLYDQPDGQARVLGGGFIRAALSRAKLDRTAA